MDKGMLMIIRKYASLRSFMINKDKRATSLSSMYASKSIATTEIKRNKRKSRFNSFSFLSIENKGIHSTFSNQDLEALMTSIPITLIAKRQGSRRELSDFAWVSI
jgi:hypothetical protein